MMAYVHGLRKSEKTYEAEMKDNPCFHRNYYEDPANASVVEYAKYGDFQKGHTKWEGRIYKALRTNLDSEDWMEKRNALLLLSQSCESFPVIERYAKSVLTCVENMRDKEEQQDLKTLANSLVVKLKSLSDNWVDKAPEPAVEKAPKEEVRKVTVSGSGVKNPLNALSNSNSNAATVQTTAQSKASPAETAKRDANGGGSEKRPRDEAKAASSTAGEAREPKQPKESKEPKAKERDRAEPKPAKEVREVKEDKRSERGRDKDRDRAKSSTTSLKETDWKRDRSGGSAPVSSQEERPEKRRRAEREPDVTIVHSSRGSDRHGGSNARNALAAPDAGSSRGTGGGGHEHSRRSAHTSSGGSSRHEHRRR